MKELWLRLHDELMQQYLQDHPEDYISAKEYADEHINEKYTQYLESMSIIIEKSATPK